jgi:peptidoglycan hydrolase CwlO-like protein
MKVLKIIWSILKKIGLSNILVVLLIVVGGLYVKNLFFQDGIIGMLNNKIKEQETIIENSEQREKELRKEIEAADEKLEELQKDLDRMEVELQEKKNEYKNITVASNASDAISRYRSRTNR